MAAEVGGKLGHITKVKIEQIEPPQQVDFTHFKNSSRATEWKIFTQKSTTLGIQRIKILSKGSEPEQQDRYQTIETANQTNPNPGRDLRHRRGRDEEDAFGDDGGPFVGDFVGSAKRVQGRNTEGEHV
ncbi:hypothetical protein LR48_Vigan02g173100 [Vigna angularis]|uniref:Uncharacterized protein n=1 Tax=Phaseolus angularis TaxID=3914 RepID=A0A0L9TYK0_PHAAN|nr:hypothetical protein LR48_Vigan02g173100 [Vigna angularis]